MWFSKKKSVSSAALVRAAVKMVLNPTQISMMIGPSEGDVGDLILRSEVAYFSAFLVMHNVMERLRASRKPPTSEETGDVVGAALLQGFVAGADEHQLDLDEFTSRLKSYSLPSHKFTGNSTEGSLAMLFALHAMGVDSNSRHEDLDRECLSNCLKIARAQFALIETVIRRIIGDGELVL